MPPNNNARGGCTTRRDNTRDNTRDNSRDNSRDNTPAVPLAVVRTGATTVPNTARDGRWRRDEGAILVVVMMVMLGLLGMGVMALWLTSGNLQVNASINQRTAALYVAEAGLERAREILNGAVPPNVDTLLAGSNGPADDVPTGLDGATATPNGAGAILIDSAGIALLGVPYPPPSFGRTGGTEENPTPILMGSYTVWIRNDTAECRRNMFTEDHNGTVVLRSRGLATDGRTTVVLEAALGPSNGTPPGPGASGPQPPVLCNAGKNACDDNNSTQYGVVVN